MSKVSVQLAHIRRSPKAMMDYQLCGRLPTATQPSSPLITYLESLGYRDRIAMVGVRLSPKVGYQSGAHFRNAEQMLRYLKPNNWVIGSFPAESCRIKSFTTEITHEVFKRAQ